MWQFLFPDFLLRVLFGAVLTGTEVSEWLYLTVLSGAFYFSLGKDDELQKKKDGIPARCLNIIREISWTKICICAWHCSIHFMHYGVRILPIAAHICYVDGPMVIFVWYLRQSDGGGKFEGSILWRSFYITGYSMALCVVYGIVMIGMLYFGA